MNTSSLQREFRKLGDGTIAEASQRFFKTGKGQYGEGDLFLGIRVPRIRAFSKQHKGLPISEVLQILRSPYHEERLLALVMLVSLFEATDNSALREEIYTSYLESTKYVNGWDLVDSSAHQIVGGYLLNKNRDVLVALSRSSSLWERRISIISTYHFIKMNQYNSTLLIAEKLLGDDEDLIHKAVGWMLREVGNRHRDVERQFLLKHYKDMPRTMLRYAIEKFEEQERKSFIRGEI
ncbi:MAG: DNA alkylation repair protein [Granulosicoccus sp.]